MNIIRAMTRKMTLKYIIAKHTVSMIKMCTVRTFIYLFSYNPRNVEALGVNNIIHAFKEQEKDF